MRGHSIKNVHEKVKKHVVCLSQTVIAFPTELFTASGASWPRINMKIGSQPLLGVAFASFFIILSSPCYVDSTCNDNNLSSRFIVRIDDRFIVFSLEKYIVTSDQNNKKEKKLYELNEEKCEK